MKKVLFVMLAVVVQAAFASLSFAADGDAGGAAGYIPLGAGLAMGLAALGGTFGQGRAVASALEGIARNPGAANKIQTPMILGLALIESLVLFSFVIAIMLVQKV